MPKRDVDLDRHVPNKVARDLRSVMDPLAADDALPEPSDLSPFFARVERVLHGIDANIRVTLLSRRAIQNLGPYLLGD